MQYCRLSKYIEHELLLKLKLAGIDETQAQKIIRSKNNTLAKQMVDIVKKEPPIQTKYELFKEFDIFIPRVYLHRYQLAYFKESILKQISFFNDDLTDGNFASGSFEIEPGQKFKIKLMNLIGIASSYDCLKILKLHKAYLVGAQGLSLLCEIVPKELPLNKWLISFDNKEHLWSDRNSKIRVPTLYRTANNKWRFDLGFFASNWDQSNSLVAFCKS